MMEKRCNGFHSSKSPTFHRKCYFPAVIFCVIVFSGKKMCSRTNQNNKLCTSLKNCKITVNYFLCVWLPHFHSAATQSLYFCFIHIWMTFFFHHFNTNIFRETEAGSSFSLSSLLSNLLQVQQCSY